ncbi:MAG: type I-U CRISPR-associated protein Cas7 [Blastochloris sp.]|nr:type I-U CRISPR-associated protein Cas7 [Blastochloris sp.]
MPLDLSALEGASRLLIEAELKPVQGHTIYPTNFPNLGAATYTDPTRGWQNLTVESQQSMANLMEAACWDGETWKEPLAGIPYVEVVDGSGKPFTWSTLEAHRLNSVYIENTDWFEKMFKADVAFNEERSYDAPRQLAPVLLKYDPNSLIHGVMLESIAGVVRLPRALGAFIEAEDIRVAAGAGAKFDRNQPSKTEGQTAKEGYGNVIYARDRYAPKRTVAYFNLDLRQIRSYVIDEIAKDFLVRFALYKIGAVLDNGCQRRRECEFRVDKIEVKGAGLKEEFCNEIKAALLNPKQIATDTTEAINKLAEKCPGALAPPKTERDSRRLTQVKYEPNRKSTNKAKSGRRNTKSEPADSNGSDD